MSKPTNLGFYYLFSGFKLIFAKKTRSYIIIPLIINSLLFIFLWYGGFKLTELSIIWFNHIVPSWLSWLAWLFYVIYFISMLIITTYCFAAVAVIIGSPFYGMLSEHIQKKLSGTSPPKTQIIDTLKIIPKSIVREISKLLTYLPWGIIILIISFIPIINLMAAFLWLIFGAWVQSIQYLDYPFDNNGLSLQQLKQTIRQNSLLTLSFGIIVLFFLMIPIINIFIIPAAVAGATKMWADHWQYQK